MSDQPIESLQGTGAGQFQGQGSEEPAAQTPSIVTQEVLEQRLAQLEANLSKMVQSQTDRTVGGLRKSVEKKLAEFSDLAVEAGMPEQLVEAEKARIWREAIDEFKDQRGQTQVAQPDEIAQINDWIYEIADELHVAPLYPKDPEFAQVNFNDPNPANFKAQYDAAIRAKAARRQGQPAPQPASTTPPDARAPMMVSGPPSGNPTLEQMTQRLRALQTKPSRTKSDWEEMKGLEAKIMAQIPRR